MCYTKSTAARKLITNAIVSQVVENEKSKKHRICHPKTLTAGSPNNENMWVCIFLELFLKDINILYHTCSIICVSKAIGGLGSASMEYSANQRCHLWVTWTEGPWPGGMSGRWDPSARVSIFKKYPSLDYLSCCVHTQDFLFTQLLIKKPKVLLDIPTPVYVWLPLRLRIRPTVPVKIISEIPNHIMPVTA